MSRRHEFTQVYAYGDVTNDDASLELLAAQTAKTYLYIEKLTLSVYKAAAGGGGVCQIKDTSGNVFKTINADGVKDIFFDWGSYGIKITTLNAGLQAVVSGAQTEQASVSVTLKGHLDTK